MAHSYHGHREQQVAHRRVNHILKNEPTGAKQHAQRPAFSKVTSKTAAEHHDSQVAGAKGAKRFARGGKVKHGHTTNVIIAPRPAQPSPPPMAGPPPGAPPAPPMGGAPGLPPGMPMRKRGGSVDGESTKADIKAWGNRARKNSFFRGGAATGVGREEKAAKARRG